MKLEIKISMRQLAILVVFLAITCQFLANSQAQGVGDGGTSGGGGTIPTSTDQQIRDALKWALQNITNAPDNETPILGGTYEYNFLVNGEYALTCITNPQACAETPETRTKLVAAGTNFDNPGQYLKLSRFYFAEDKPCPNYNKKEHKEPAASVSKFAYGADVCFSLFKLRSVPLNGLKATVFALLFHEMAHLSGYGEDVAVRAQKIIEHHWAELTMTDGSWVKDRLVYDLDEILYNLRHAKKSLAKHRRPSLDQIIAFAEANTRMSIILNSMPSRTEITLPMAHPDMENEVQDLAFALAMRMDNDLAKLKTGMPRSAYLAEIDSLFAEIINLRFKMQICYEGHVFDQELFYRLDHLE